MNSSPLRPAVLERSGGHCEAMVLIPSTSTWARCGVSPVEDHHVLPRSRGGGLLDEQGEIYHHLALCRTHHAGVYDHQDSGLMIDGYVVRDGTRVIYSGPDHYLREKYS